MRRIYLVLVTIITCSLCRTTSYAYSQYSVRADLRSGSVFYSLFFDESGSGLVVKGVGSSYREPLVVGVSDTSQVFKLDSIQSFFKMIDKFEKSPVVGPTFSDQPRLEVYHNNKKIYDAVRWDLEFWDLFRPVMEQIPLAFNPFYINSDTDPFSRERVLSKKIDQNEKLEICIDPKNYGWYFVELRRDSTEELSKKHTVKVDNTSQLKRVSVHEINGIVVSVFNQSGNEISRDMRAPGVLYHQSGRVFFKFYNPTPEELANITAWNPTDARYFAIQSQSQLQLSKLLNKKK